MEKERTNDEEVKLLKEKTIDLIDKIPDKHLERTYKFVKCVSEMSSKINRIGHETRYCRGKSVWSEQNVRRRSGTGTGKTQLTITEICAAKFAIIDKEIR